MGDPEDDAQTTATPPENKGATSDHEESALGKKFVGLAGALTITAYLILFTVVDLYTLVKVWPPPPAPAPTQSPPPTAGGEQKAAEQKAAEQKTGGQKAGEKKSAEQKTSEKKAEEQKTSEQKAGEQKGASATPVPTPTRTPTPPVPQEPWKVQFFWSDDKYNFTTDGAIFLIVILSGAIGALVRSLRSIYWYIGNGHLRWRWAAMYALMPFIGGLIAVVFYLVVRGGFMSQNVGSNTAFGFAAMGAIVGLFSDQAVLQLKEIADKVLAKPEKGKDSVPAQPAAAPPKLTKISPEQGSKAGGTPVTLAGENFETGMKVNIGGTPATQIVIQGKTSATAVTPAHATGEAVNVEVVNPDNQKAVLSAKFTYQ